MTPESKAMVAYCARKAREDAGDAGAWQTLKMWAETRSDPAIVIGMVRDNYRSAQETLVGEYDPEWSKVWQRDIRVYQAFLNWHTARKAER